VASLGIGGESLVPSMHEAFHFARQRQPASVFPRDGAHAEDLIRANGYASFFALAAVAVYFRFEDPCFRAALRIIVTHYGIQSSKLNSSCKAKLH
jgi:hypothetical protein